MVIMMENETYSSVIGNASLPYLNNTLASHYLVLQQAFAVSHPSLPDYLELLSGSTWGVSSDCSPGPGCQGGTSLPNELDQAGINWAAYLESMPVAGYTGGDTGGADGYGNELYAQHHNPFVYFPSLATELTTHVKPLTSMVADLNSADPPAFAWVSPNMLDDMHDGPLSTGDAWLSQEIPAVQATQWYRNGGAIVLMWDEGQSSDTSGIAGGHGGHVAEIVISGALYGRPPDAAPVDEAGVLRSIEQTYGLAYLNDSADPAHGSVGGL
jgi:acid phosphatase